jgi:hypothetical protein
MVAIEPDHDQRWSGHGDRSKLATLAWECGWDAAIEAVKQSLRKVVNDD